MGAPRTSSELTQAFGATVGRSAEGKVAADRPASARTATGPIGDQQLAELYGLIIKEHQEVVTRLAELTGLGVASAQQVIAAWAPVAWTFPSSANLLSWVGPVGASSGSEQSTGQRKSRSMQASEYRRWDPYQVAGARVKSKGSCSQSVFRGLVRRRGYQAAVRAAARRLSGVIGRILDQRTGATGQRIESAPTLFIARARSLAKQPVHEFSWNVEITSLNTHSISPAGRV